MRCVLLGVALAALLPAASYANPVEELSQRSEASNDEAPARVHFQGLVALERAATEKYAPEIARNGPVYKLEDTEQADWMFLGFLGIVLAFLFLFTPRGQELANMVPFLRPLALQAARISVAVQQQADAGIQRKKADGDVESGPGSSAKDKPAESNKSVELTGARTSSSQD
mmetsp:Transcript_57599/g.136952  ORF Transcript_57599/g.136952 Transcript_57599/m.136952 type:complete len:171 (-) Transcript_57599:89-601(-)